MAEQNVLLRSIVVSRSQTAFFLLYGVGKERVWYNGTANSVQTTTALTVAADWQSPLLHKGVKGS